MNETNKKILIVEDDADFLSIIQKALADEGFLIASASDGEEGLKVAEKEKPDLIIIDIKLPGMDGIEMAKKMKESNINAPIIFLTNAKEVDYISRAMEVAEADYIVKTDMPIKDVVARVKSKLGIK